jgi:hypothetical protein
MGCPSSAAASVFRPSDIPRTAGQVPGEKPSKQEGHPIPRPYHLRMPVFVFAPFLFPFPFVFANFLLPLGA